MFKKKWMIYGKKADFNSIAERFHISPVTARIIRNRDIIENEDIDNYLHGNIGDLASPFLLEDCKLAVELIYDAIKENKSIRVIGDYDIDGICSTYILTTGFKLLNGNVSMDIPDRVKDGYGINKSIIDRAYRDGVNLICTCDNGIAAIEEIDYAKSLGMTVIVTDHHDVPFCNEAGKKVYKLVNADAVVNHKREDCKYPFKEMCGAGIAYRFLDALIIEGKTKGYNVKKLEEAMEEMLIFAAIATVGDVVSLTGENRIIVKRGLQLIHNSSNIGLKALISECGLEGVKISAYHIGFVIGPCLNASGRLETAKMGYDLLCEINSEIALKKASELVELNNHRKELTANGVEEARKIAKEYLMDRVLVIYLNNVHESIVGIIAGRIREEFHKPTIVFTHGEDIVKGSGRSIEGYHMYNEINKCSSLLDKFGGHEMAAGMSIKEENINEFRELLNKNAILTEEDLVKKVWIDVELPFSYINEEFINELSVIEPFGKDNSKPLFAVRDAKITRLYLIGKQKNIIKMQLEEKGYTLTAVMFKNTEDFFECVEAKYGEEITNNLKMGMSTDIKVSFIFYPSINEYNGNKYLQIIVEDYIV
ncbi:MAG: single-stranded-DNA-specific exonuclease RecJ [Clostridiales bacterium]|nr:single-stranded-DNA-specific exonuclease RecJ [Clostridiales bacterium]